MNKIAWIAVDWGTSQLRAWAMDSKGKALDQRLSDQGMSKLTQADFEPCLLYLIEDWLSDEPMNVIACGMVGSKQGWQEAPYIASPCSPTTQTTKVRSLDPRIRTRILAGVKQNEPADVMRGEETQIAGFLSLEPRFDGVICLPGTHTKWARVKEGQVITFKTTMTGEIFELMSTQSILKHSLGQWDDALFLNACAHSLDHPEDTLTELFSIRACALLHGKKDGVAKLSGALIGSELAGTKSLWHNHEVVIIGDDRLSRLYLNALKNCAARARRLDAFELTLAGLTLAYKGIEND